MDFQHRPGGKTGSGGVASSSESNRDRRERLRQLALETIDINKVHVPSHRLCPPCTRELHLEWQLSVSTRGWLLFVAPRLKGLLAQETILSQRCGESPVVGALMAPRAAKDSSLSVQSCRETGLRLGPGDTYVGPPGRCGVCSSIPALPPRQMPGAPQSQWPQMSPYVAQCPLGGGITSGETPGIGIPLTPGGWVP